MVVAFPAKSVKQRAEVVPSSDSGLDPRIPFVIDIILPIAALAALDPGKAFDSLDPLDIFGVLVTELALDPEA